MDVPRHDKRVQVVIILGTKGEIHKYTIKTAATKPFATVFVLNAKNDWKHKNQNTVVNISFIGKLSMLGITKTILSHEI